MTPERIAELRRLCDALGGIYKIECQHCERMTVVTQGARADMLLAAAAVPELLAEVGRLGEIVENSYYGLPPEDYAKLKAEVERLRAGLKHIADGGTWCESVDDTRLCGYYAQKILDGGAK